MKRQTKNAEDRRKQVEGMSLQTVETLAGAIDAKDPYTKGHSVRVAEYAVLLAEMLGYGKKELTNLRYAALLHDVGKISIPDSVLNKPSKLSDIEFNIIKSHTTVGSSILEKIESMHGIDEAARYHHERYDGKGYPEGICGMAIPENARIISIADSYDAMNSKRVYRSKLSKEKIREELVKGKGTQFDPDMLVVFLRLFDEGKLEAVEHMEIVSEHSDGTGEILQKVIENMASNGEQERDSLTGLLLRKGGEMAIVKEMQLNPGALAFIDVDNLKVINDSMGHLAGDHLLGVVGRVLVGYEDRGIITRIGGDEFLFFIRNAGEQEAEELLRKLMSDFEAVKEEDTVIRKSSLSIGVCLSRITDEYQTIFRRADNALYYVKTQGKSGIQIYEKKDKNRVSEKADIDLKKLVDLLEKSGNYKGAMDVEYQMFSKLYEYTQNLCERNQQNYELVMITLDMDREIEIDEIEHAMDCMGESIQQGIRSVDICTRYSSVQYLVILMNAKQEEIETIMDRIFKGFYKNNSGHGIQISYHVVRGCVMHEPLIW